jgi:hypothetical protein
LYRFSPREAYLPVTKPWLRQAVLGLTLTCLSSFRGVVELFNLELQDRGFAPQATIADAGKGLRAGQALAGPDHPTRRELFDFLVAE